MNTKISKALVNYEPYYEKILPTGSRVICDPPPKETDDDYLILVKPDQRIALEVRLQQEGWTLGGSLPNDSGLDVDPHHGSWELNTEHQYVGGVIDHSRVFHSWKRQETPTVFGEVVTGEIFNTHPVVTIGSGPEINLLVTCNEQYFDDFTRATFLAQGLNLKDKADRVILFEALTRDVWPSGRKKKLRESMRYSILYDDVMMNGFETLQNTAPMTAMELVNLQIAQAAVNPPIFWNNATIVNPPAPGQTVTLMNGQVVTG